MTEPKWLRVEQAALYVSKRYAKVGVSFIRDLIRDGHLPFVRVGKYHVVEATDLDACLQKMKARTAKKTPRKK